MVRKRAFVGSNPTRPTQFPSDILECGDLNMSDIPKVLFVNSFSNNTYDRSGSWFTPFLTTASILIKHW